MPPTPYPPALIQQLRDSIGAAHVLTEPNLWATFLDEPRGRFRQSPLAVARPGTPEQVAEVTRQCRAAGIPLVTRGGGTGTVGGAAMARAGAGILLSLDRMRAIESVDAEAAQLTAQAGVTLEQARAAAAELDLDVPLGLASGGSATLGGILATNAGGNTTIRHGNARRMALGLEAVLADGRRLDLRSGLRKDNSGYDLIDLLIGSEGTLGIITAATIGLVPRPRQRATAWCAVASPRHAVALLGHCRRRLGETLSAFELMPRLALELSISHLDGGRDPLSAPAPWYVLVDADSAIVGDWLEPTLTELLAEAGEQGLVADAVLATSQAQAAELWALREAVSPAQKQIGASIKHDIAVPIAAIPAMIDATLADLAARFPGIRPCVFGHVGDGNLHFNLSRPQDWSDEAFVAIEPEINQVVFDRVQALGGSIAAEHGIGQLRLAELARRGDPVKLDVMRRIKRALDPDNLLNPGKMIELHPVVNPD